MFFSTRELIQVHNQHNPYVEIVLLDRTKNDLVVNLKYEELSISKNETTLYVAPICFFDREQCICSDLVVTNLRILFKNGFDYTSQFSLGEIKKWQILNDETVLLEFDSYKIAMITDSSLVPFIYQMISVAKERYMTICHV